MDVDVEVCDNASFSEEVSDSARLQSCSERVHIGTFISILFVLLTFSRASALLCALQEPYRIT